MAVISCMELVLGGMRGERSAPATEAPQAPDIPSWRGGVAGIRCNPLAALALAFAVAGCAEGQRHLYRWGDYDEALYAVAQAPQDNERYLERLRQIIIQAEATQDRVPPGLYAEYGYALFTGGQLDDAVTFYAKERDTWPESRVFMEKMIRNTQRLRQGRPPAPGDGPPAPAPGTPPPTSPAAPAASPAGRP